MEMSSAVPPGLVSFATLTRHSRAGLDSWIRAVEALTQRERVAAGRVRENRPNPPALTKRRWTIH